MNVKRFLWVFIRTAVVSFCGLAAMSNAAFLLQIHGVVNAAHLESASPVTPYHYANAVIFSILFLVLLWDLNKEYAAKVSQ